MSCASSGALRNFEILIFTATFLLKKMLNIAGYKDDPERSADYYVKFSTKEISRS